MYEAINERNWDAGFALLADGFTWHEPAQAFHGGVHTGFGEIRERLEAQIEVFDEFTIEPEELHVRGDRVAVAVLQRARGQTSGVKVEIRISHLWTVTGERIGRLDVYAGRNEALEAIGVGLSEES
jgi:ketosteroid isomerase-like protein